MTWAHAGEMIVLITIGFWAGVGTERRRAYRAKQRRHFELYGGRTARFQRWFKTRRRHT